jgi:hypothetical protein
MFIRCARLVLCSSFVLLGGAVTTVSGQTPVHEDSSRELFRERVAEYTRMRQRIVEELQLNGSARDAKGGAGFEERLAARIRQQRRQSKAGDIMCPEVAGRIVQLVRSDMLNRRQPDRLAILAEVPQVPLVRLNDFYPAGAPLATVPPLLLLQLDPLPPELQYRFLENALILLDVETNLIIDYVPNAFRRSS